MNGQGGLAASLSTLPLFDADWVIWLLAALSFISVAIILERWYFFFRRHINADAVRTHLDQLLSKRDYAKAAEYLQRFDSLETNVVLFGLRRYQLGADSVEELLRGAEAKEKQRYSRRLSFLATVGSNAPFIGLFGTVLGIIRAFRNLAENTAGVGNSVMFGISEALVTTAVGLVVAIPAVIGYNILSGKLKEISGNADFLSRTLLAMLKADDQEGGA